ncbi:hypothetical protein BHU72_13090 [Desulfuribacillus stibiiarsenatis]|uniref:YetF C-terminal domain-containing protein n=1 Tax=Desulfuribacillus stibiiarsenatis TaxID=1390249 RepID=A0A1E5L905_9FIRM|nr:DUF421 domain-containing protein [Desulfuribacillus stibiiarsenatis]OEH86538.1 hypothetical protein BHU72_13090 [Desulfuribacillus stibiiarsenatis]
MDLYELFQAVLYPIVVFILLIILVRLVGKKMLGQLTFFDFVTGITLGNIGGAFVTSEVKGNYVLLSSVVFAGMALITGFITLKSVTARKLIEGEPIIVIQNGKILEHNMKSIRYNQDDLVMQLRDKNIFDMTEVDLAMIEPHGTLSVIKKNAKHGISTELVRDGRIQELNLKQLNKTHEWLYNELMKHGVKDVNEVFLAALNKNGNIYIDTRDDKIEDVYKVKDDDSLIE